MELNCKLDHADPDVIPVFLCRACNPQLNERPAPIPGPDASTPTEAIERLERRRKRQLRAEVKVWRNRVELMKKHKVNPTDLKKAEDTLRKVENDLYLVA